MTVRANKKLFEGTQRIPSSDIDLNENVVSIQRVAKVNKGGRTFSFAAVVVVGNGDGIVGIGLGKAREVTEAITKGTNDAKKQLVKVPVLNGTIPHDTEKKYSGGHVFLKPAAPGTGIIAGGAMRSVLDAAGVKNVLGKSKGSSNPHNVVKATLKALIELEDPHKVAQKRGVSLSKVFNG